MIPHHLENFTMPKFSERSLTALNTCHPDLVRIASAAIEVVDFSILCGYRSLEDQKLAFVTGHSKARPGESLHNQMPSLAFDFAPYPIDWNRLHPFYRVAGVLQGIASQMGIQIRLGIDFKSIQDYGHVELVLK